MLHNQPLVKHMLHFVSERVTDCVSTAVQINALLSNWNSLRKSRPVLRVTWHRLKILCKTAPSIHYSLLAVNSSAVLPSRLMHHAFNQISFQIGSKQRVFRIYLSRLWI